MVTIILILLVYSIVNFRVLRNEMTDAVAAGSLTLMAIFFFALEIVPNIIGLEPTIITALIAGLSIPYIITLLIIAVTIANFLSYYIGRSFSSYIRGFIKAKDIHKYEKLWKKYGKATMIITAISPIPYFPALAGLFKMDVKFFTFAVVTSRIARHLVVIAFLIALFG